MSSQISYITILQAIESFASSHIQVQKFASDFYAEIPNLITKDEAFPVLFVTPSDSTFDINATTFGIDVYCLDLIQKDRSNINTILSDTNLILNDLKVWLTDGNLAGIDIIEVATASPINNSMLDYAAGYVASYQIIIDAYGICDIPFNGQPIITGPCNSITYSKLLTCESLVDCPVIQDILGAISGGTGETFTGGTVNGPTIFTNGLSANTISATTYLGLPPDVYVTGGTFDFNTESITFVNSTGGSFTVTGVSSTNVTGGTISTGGTITFVNNDNTSFTVTGVTPFTRTLNINGNQYDLSNDREWRVAQGDSGVLSYEGAVSASSNTVNIGAVNGFIIDNLSDPNIPSYIQVFFTGQTGVNIVTTGSNATYILLNSAGNIVTQNTYPTSAQRKALIYLSKVGHPEGVMTYVIDEPDYINSPLAQMRDLSYALQYINNGILAYPATGLTFNTSGGVIYGNGLNYVVDPYNPNFLNILAQAPTSFEYRNQTGGTEIATSILDPTQYDVSGVTTAVPSSSTTIQYLYFVPNAGYGLQRGQYLYPSLNDAINNVGKEAFVVYDNFVQNAILIGVIVMTATGTDVTNPNQFRFIKADKLGQLFSSSAGGSSSTIGDLQSAYNNSTQPQITINPTNGALIVKGYGDPNADVVAVQNIVNDLTFRVTEKGDVYGQHNAIFGSGHSINGNNLLVNGINNSADTNAQSVLINGKDNIVNISADANGNNSIITGWGNTAETPTHSLIVGAMNNVGYTTGAIIAGNLNTAPGNGANNYVFGDFNILGFSSNKNAVFGEQNNVDGSENLVYGALNTALGSNSLVGGLNNVGGGGHNYSIMGGYTNYSDASSSLIIGVNNILDVYSNNSIIFGSVNTSNTTVQANNNLIGGDGNSIVGANDTLTNNNLIAGKSNTVNNVVNSMIIGGFNNITNLDGGLIAGYANTATTSSDNCIIGNLNTAGPSAIRNTIFGSQNYSDGEENLVFGRNNTNNYGVTSLIGGQNNSTTGNLQNSILVGDGNISDSSRSLIVGNINTIDAGVSDSIIFGNNNTSNIAANFISSILGGGQNTINNSYTNSLVIGRSNIVNGFVDLQFNENNIIGGLSNTINGTVGFVNNNIIAGESNTVDSIQNSLVIGASNNIGFTNSNIIAGQSISLLTGNYNAIFGTSHSNIDGGVNLIAGDSHQFNGTSQASLIVGQTNFINTFCDGMIMGGVGNTMTNSTKGAIFGFGNQMIDVNYGLAMGENTVNLAHGSFVGGVSTQTSPAAVNSIVYGDTSVSNAANTFVFGAGITANDPDKTYVEQLNIKTVGATAPVTNLGIDADGNVVSGTTGGGGGGGTGFTTMQDAYDNSAGAPQIITTLANDPVTFRGFSESAPNQAVFRIQDSGGANVTIMNTLGRITTNEVLASRFTKNGAVDGEILAATGGTRTEFYGQGRTSPYGSAVGLQQMFDIGTGAVPIKPNTVYQFSVQLVLSNLAATSGNVGFGFKGTGGGASFNFVSDCTKVAAFTTPSASQQVYSTTFGVNTPIALTTNNTATAFRGTIQGIIRNTSLTSIIPCVNFSVSGGTNSIEYQFFELKEVGPFTSVGFSTFGPWF